MRARLPTSTGNQSPSPAGHDVQPELMDRADLPQVRTRLSRYNTSSIFWGTHPIAPNLLRDGLWNRAISRSTH